MTRSTFTSFALDCGLSMALILGLANGVSQAQLDLWVAGLAEYRSHHHYTH